MSKRSSPSSSAKAPSERLGSSRSGTSRLRDFHSIKFRPADIPVWLSASRERLLRAPRPLRLRLRCQQGKRCRSASGCGALRLHTPRLTDPSHWLQAGKTVDILRCAAESTDLLPPSALPRQQAYLLPGISTPGLRPPPFRGTLLPPAAVACGYAHPPGDAGCGDFVTFAMAALPVAGRLPAGAGHRAAVVDCDVIAGGSLYR